MFVVCFFFSGRPPGLTSYLCLGVSGVFDLYIDVLSGSMSVGVIFYINDNIRKNIIGFIRFWVFRILKKESVLNWS